MFEGGNKNLAAYMQHPYYGKRQQFHYDHDTKYWQSEATNNIIGFDWDNWLADDTVGTFDSLLEENQKKHGMRWDIYYCKDKDGNKATQPAQAAAQMPKEDPHKDHGNTHSHVQKASKEVTAKKAPEKKQTNVVQKTAVQ